MEENIGIPEKLLNNGAGSYPGGHPLAIDNAEIWHLANNIYTRLCDDRSTWSVRGVYEFGECEVTIVAVHHELGECAINLFVRQEPTGPPAVKEDFIVADIMLRGPNEAVLGQAFFKHASMMQVSHWVSAWLGAPVYP